MKFVRMAALVAGVLALSLSAIACGDDDDDGENGDATRPAATSEATEEPEPTEPAGDPTEPAGAAAVTVVAADFAFNPTTISVDGSRDTTVTLENSGSAPHTMNVYSDQGFTTAVDGASTDQVAGGGSGEFTLTSTAIGDATQLFFRCEVHPSQMQGAITVQ